MDKRELAWLAISPPQMCKLNRLGTTFIIAVVALMMVQRPAFSQCQANENAELTAVDAAFFDIFGGSVAISGKIAVIGAMNQGNSGGNLGFGKVYVFEFDGDNWAQVAELTPSDPESDKEFGGRVAIECDTIVVGAGQDGGGINIGPGAAYVFVRPAGGWINMTETAKLTASDAAPVDVFGLAIAISGDVIVVGAPNNDDAGGQTGSAYIYEKPVCGWVAMTESQKLLASDMTAGDYFGCGADIDGDTIVIGADNIVNNGTGSAYVFERQIGGWVETAKLIPSDGASGDWFGFDPAIRGNTVCIGAPRDDDGAANTGSVYIFEKPVDGWASVVTPINEIAKLSTSDAVTGDNFGISVTIDQDRKTILVGAYAGDNSSRTGSVYIFRKPSEGWESAPSPINENMQLSPSDVAAGDRVGRSVAVSGGIAVIGASRHDHSGIVWTGGAWIFQGVSDINANGTLDICESGIPGDMNGDGLVDAEDIAPFATKLLNP